MFFKKYGLDISKRRTDKLEKKAIKFSIETNNGDVFLDLGSGVGKMGLIFYLIGKKTYLYDIKLGFIFIKLISLFFLNKKNLILKRKNLKKIKYKDIPTNITCVFSGRTFHYLNREELENLVKIFSKKIKKKWPYFFLYKFRRNI